MKIIPVQVVVVVVIAMALLVEAPVALESILPTDLIRIQEKKLPYIIMIIQETDTAVKKTLFPN